MARIRTIKPEFWTDDTITECSLSARLLFIGLWNFADDAGNLDRSPKQIKARVFPVDNIDCEPLISELLAHGLLIEYSVSEQKYLHIPGFTTHQLINRPSRPIVPGFDDSLKTHGVLTESSQSTHSGLEGKGSNGESTNGAEAPAPKKANARGKPRSELVPFPEDLTLNDVMREQAIRKHHDCDPESWFEQFKAHHVAHGKAMKSWAAAWVTWIGNGERFGYPKRMAARGWV